jgi:hypothetical protein
MPGQALYGPGSLYVRRTDIANGTPVNLGYVNEFSISEKGETKQLFGQTDYPLAVRRGTIKSTFKAKSALLTASGFNVFNGGNITAGTQILGSLAEAATVPASGGFTVAAAHAAAFNADVGVTYQNNGSPLFRPLNGTLSAAGQYTVSNGGTYTFDSIDAGAAVLLAYLYNNTTGGGFHKVVSAQIIGSMPTFEMWYVNTDPEYGTYTFHAYNCVAGSLDRSFKLTDFMMPELDIEMAQNAAGVVYEESYSPFGA